MDYKIISDGCCDLEKEIIEQYNLRIIPFYISFDEETYYKEIEEIGIREVYERMVGNPDVYPKTSLPSVQNYIDVFTEYVKEGTPVVCICFTPSLSGSYNCACNAREIVCEDYPDAKIAVINSEAGTIFFTVGNTDYLKHGGRIGKLAGIASSALSLKPLITLVNGEIEASGIGRSRKKTVAKTIALMDDYFKETGDAMEDYSFRVGFGYDIEEGKEYYNAVANHIYGESHVDQVGICQIGATIAVHTGPYAIGIGCVKKYENYLIH